MTTLPFEVIKTYRAKTFHLLPGLHLENRDQAVMYVNERGFIFFWPISGITLPSLWTAVAGDRPVADAHDDPGHMTWGWKDALLGKREWFYAKVLRKKATMISLQVAPFFYALSENYGSPEDDYLTLYEQGRLTLEARLVYEALLDKGPLDTITLRRETHMTSRESETRFNKALSDLQADFKILPVGVADAGSWHYAFIYDIVARVYPELPDLAQHIRENDARKELARHYFRSLGAAQLHDLIKLFGWKPTYAELAVNDLSKEGVLLRGMEVTNKPGEWIALRQLFFSDFR